MTRDITRYANRKMYDARTRGYITLAGILKLVGKGEAIRVEDRESREDITASVLLQALMEAEKAKPGSVSSVAVAALARKSSVKRGR